MAAADYRLLTEATGQRIAAALESLVNLGDPVTIAHGGTGASTAAAALSALGGVAVTDIVNDLTSTLTNKPLSANMGKTLNDKLDNNTIPTLNTLKYTQFGKLIIVGGYFDGNGTDTINTGFPSGYFGCIPVRDATIGIMSLYYHNNQSKLRGWDGNTDRVFETNHTYQVTGVLYKE